MKYDKLDKLIIAVTIIFSIAFVILCLGGCYQDNTGGWHLGRSAAEAIDKGLDAGAQGLGLLSLFVPGVAGLAGIAAGLAGAFKKLKPQLTKSKQVNEHVVTTIETIKKLYPSVWEAIKDEFKDGTNDDIEETIEKIIQMQKTLETK